MAGDKVKKGFAFYLFMFILLIVAAFMVIVTIMLFSPGKSILGFKYFSYNETVTLNEIQLEEEAHVRELNFVDVNKVIVNTERANVNIYKSDEVNVYTVQIVKKCSGFAKSNQDTDFQIKSFGLYEQPGPGPEFADHLVINIAEPDGFVFFSNKVQVNIIVPEKQAFLDEKGELIKDEKTGEVKLYDNTSFFNDATIEVTTEKGNVTLGAAGEEDDQPISKVNSIAPKGLAIKTDSGNIKFNKYCQIEAIPVALVTNSGNITSDIDVRLTQENNITTNKGKIKFNYIRGNTTYTVDFVLNLNLGNGTFEAGNIVGTVNLVTTSGKFSVTKSILGHFSTGESRDSIKAPEINIKKIEGEVSIPYGNNAKIFIGEVQNKMNIALNKGSVRVGYDTAITRGGNYISTVNGKIEATIGNILSADKINKFESNSGEIKLSFTGTVNSKNYVIAQTSNVDVSVYQTSAFLFEAKTTDEKYINALSKNLSLEFIDATAFTMPLYVHGYTGTDNVISIQTNGKIAGHVIR